MINPLFIFCLCLLLLSGCNPGNGRQDEFVAYDANLYKRVAINYEIQGKGDTTLVFIHGWNLDLRYWDYPVKHLKSDYRVLALDLAGHGSSGKDRTNWAAESFAQDIVNIIKKEELKNIILIAHSMGGEIALEVVNQIPEKIIGMIGVENFRDVDFSITPAFRQDFTSYLNKFKTDYPEMADAYAREHIRSTNRDVINRIVKDYKKSDPKVALTIFKNMVPKYAEAKQNLQRLPFKLRIIASDYAPYNEGALKRYARNGYEIVWIDQAGHFPMVEQPEEFLSALEAMLKDI